jgi:hypothetical protein
VRIITDNLRDLGHNQLTELPAAINELKNLKELNVSNNKIVSCMARINWTTADATGH